MTRVEHEHLLNGERQVAQLIRIASKGPVRRTLFIEGTGVSDASVPNPFNRAISEARRRGWVVVGLDHPSQLAALSRMPPSVRRRYLMYDVRERGWPGKLQRHGFGPNDLVVLHPAHVRRFIRANGIPPSAVHWIHPENPIFSTRPLSDSERRQFQQQSRRRRVRRALEKSHPR